MTKATRRSSLEAEYREYVKTTVTWQLIDDLIHLRKVIRWLPGSNSGVAIGFLIVVPISAWMTVLSALFKGALPETHVAQIWALGMLSIVIHSSFMFCMSMGFIWGQKYLIRYLWVVRLLSLIFLGIAIYVKASPFVIGFAAAGFVVSAFILSLARGKMFSVYAEIMRVKRIYMQDRREYLAELATQRRSSRKKAKK
jgi:hypothetical protein